MSLFKLFHVIENVYLNIGCITITIWILISVLVLNNVYECILCEHAY